MIGKINNYQRGVLFAYPSGRVAVFPVRVA